MANPSDTSKSAVNVCAGPFGALYDIYIERPRLMRLVGRALWGIDASPLYASMESLAEMTDGGTVADVPCGGGVAFRALSPGQDVRYIAGDIDPKMLDRARRRARGHSLRQVEFALADMTALPFAGAEVDLFLSYSGLHMVDDQREAIEEIARCLRPGGRVVGTTFFSDGARRARWAFAMGRRRGHAVPPDRADVVTWLAAAGLEEICIGPQPGFAVFEARKPR